MQVCLELQLLSNFALHVQLPIVQTSVQSENWTISQMAEIKTSLEQKSTLLNTASWKPPNIVDKGILMLVVSPRWPMCLRSIAPNEPNLTNRAEDLWTNGGRESVGLVLMGKSATAGQVHTSWRRVKPCGAWCWIRPGDSYYCKMTPEWHKMWSRLTAQICHFFWLITRNQDFRQQVLYFNVSRQKVSYFDVFNTGKAC